MSDTPDNFVDNDQFDDESPGQSQEIAEVQPLPQPAQDEEFDQEEEAEEEAHAQVTQNQDTPAEENENEDADEENDEADNEDDKQEEADEFDHDEEEQQQAEETEEDQTPVSAIPTFDRTETVEGDDDEGFDPEQSVAEGVSRPASRASRPVTRSSRPSTAAAEASQSLEENPSRPGTAAASPVAKATHEDSEAEPSRSVAESRLIFNEEDDILDEFEIPDLPEDKLYELDYIRREVEASQLPDRIAQLRKEVEDQTIMVGTVSLEDVKLEEARLEDIRIDSVRQELAQHQRRQVDLLTREMEARKRLNAERQTNVLESREDAMSIVARSMISNKEQQTAFRKAEDRLKGVLADQQATVNVEFGELGEDDSGVKGRRYQVSWDNAPRLLCVKNMVLRAVKNKLPAGRYVMLVTLFDRLGGVPLRWSQIKDFNYFHRTRNPVKHNGRYYDVELNFKQRVNNIFLACPAKSQTTPSMCMVFELFQIRNTSRNKSDKVVAWGAFPLSDPSFDIVKGYYKLPLLRGEYDPSIEKYEQIEQRMAGNIDSWLCNLYFTAEHWPRYMNGMREYDVELKFTQNLLQLPEFDTKNNPRIGLEEEEEEMSDDDMATSAGGWRNLWSQSNGKSNGGDVDDLDSLINSGGSTGSGNNSFLRRVGMNNNNKSSVTSSNANVNLTNKSFDVMMTLDSLKPPPKDSQSASNPLSVDGVIKDDVTQLAERLSSLLPPAKHSVKTLAKSSPMDIFKDLDQEQESEAELLRQQREQTKLEDARKQTRLLQKYRFSISDPNTDIQGDPLQEKIRYLKSEVFADISWNRKYTYDFWTFMITFFLMIWLRVYTRYLGQYLFLEGTNVVMTSVDVKAWTMRNVYNNSTADLSTELGAVFIPVISNIAIYFVLMIFAWVMQKTLRMFPDAFSRIMLSWGIVCILDPLFVILVDVCDTYWTGDAFKLYNYYEREEGNGVPGILLTIAIYLVLMTVSTFFLYEYLIFLHANGRLLDLHNRLHGDEGNFFIPQDFELSIRTLRWILTKTRRSGAGLLGAKNKISVTSYTVRDHLDPAYKATTIHLAIFKQPLNGEEQLFRHFVRQPDGAILEIFDNVEAAGIDEYKRLEARFMRKPANPTSTGRTGVLSPVGSNRTLAANPRNTNNNVIRRRSLDTESTGFLPQKKGYSLASEI